MTMYSQHYNIGKPRHWNSPDSSSNMFKAYPSSAELSYSSLKTHRTCFADERRILENALKQFQHQRPRTSSMSSSRSSNGSMSLPKRPMLYKTTLCEVWSKGRNCRFGERCWFAHGEWELRSSMQNKTRKPDIHSVPSRAQQEWMVLSQTGSPTGNFNSFSKSSINRFSRDAVSAQLRAGVEARLGKDSAAGCSLDSWSKLGALLQSIPSTRQDDSNHSVWSASDVSLSSSSSSEMGGTRGFSYLDNLKEDTIVSHEICDMFAASGFCALGDDCSLEHRMRDFTCA